MDLRRFLNYLNPISRLGKRKYYFLYSTVGTFFVYFALEILLKLFSVPSSQASGMIIFISIASIIYFSFHSGIKGGIISSLITILYYFYIVYSRHYQGKEYDSGIESIFLLGILYLGVGSLIGWLKETVDKLIEKEADGRRRLQSIIAQLPVGIVISDKEGKIVQQNRRLEEILGYKISDEFIIGKNVIYKNTKVDQTPLALALKNGKVTKGRQFELSKDGKTAYLLVSATPIKNRRGDIVSAVSVIDDITQEKELEKRKDDFINIASHELKTPITSLKLYVEILTKKLKQNGDDGAKKTLQSIEYQTEKLQELVSDLLDVSGLDTGKIRFNKEVFRLDSLIEDTIAELKPTAKQEIVINKNSIKVFADKFRIYQVITNLITNAIKYSPSGSRIIVKMKKSKGVATISVQDFGIGVSKDQTSKIFERLYQVEDNEEKTFPGFGLGLFISKEIIKRHRGKIWAESKKGEGSTFYFTLPAEK